MKYAVLDWDNTVRSEFTLFSWMQFLYNKNVINRNQVEPKIDLLKTDYETGKINHDDFAGLACSTYSNAIKGIKITEYSCLVDEYIQHDRKDIFEFSNTIFHFLKKNNIVPIIISGAPYRILKKYEEDFDLYSIYAFSEQFVNGICTGAVEYNYGLNKRYTIEKLIADFGEYPIIGFGDSSSDIPIFDLSQYSFCVFDREKKVKKYGEKPVYIDSTITEEDLLCLLRSIIITGVS